MMNHHFLNTMARSAGQRGLFRPEEYDDVTSFFGEALATPLVRLSKLASSTGIGDLLLKDESSRFGLNSFKTLGVSYAVGRLLREGRLATDAVLVCATEGNHGRAVARAARDNGLQAKVYMSSDAASQRVEAIAQEGAEVIKIAGDYDTAVRLAANDANRNGWMIISDTSWDGYEEIPRLIMAGYTQLMFEAEAQSAPEAPPDVVLVQAGVGGLACAVVSWLCHRYGANRPFTIICEPANAACVLESARAGESVSLTGPFATIMAGLRCGHVSPLAWPVLASAADAFVSIDEAQCVGGMRALAKPAGDDPVILAGASGACGLAALLAIMQDKGLQAVRKASGIDVESRVLVISTEGITDAVVHKRAVEGVTPDGL